MLISTPKAEYWLSMADVLKLGPGILGLLPACHQLTRLTQEAAVISWSLYVASDSSIRVQDEDVTLDQS